MCKNNYLIVLRSNIFRMVLHWDVCKIQCHVFHLLVVVFNVSEVEFIELQ